MYRVALQLQKSLFNSSMTLNTVIITGAYKYLIPYFVSIIFSATIYFRKYCYLLIICQDSSKHRSV